MRTSAPPVAFSSGANVLSGEFLATFRGLHGGSIFPRRATSTCPLALPPELDVGRSVGPARSASLAVRSLLPSGTHVPCPDRTRLCRARETILSLTLSLSFSRRPQHPAVPESPRINRRGFFAGWIAREISRRINGTSNGRSASGERGSFSRCETSAD